MKFNTNKLLAVLAVASLGVACNKEQLQDEIPSSGNGTVQVVVSLDNSSKSFTDAEGVKWEVGDQIKCGGEIQLVSAPLTESQILNGGYEASFTFDEALINKSRKVWFCSTKCHPDNYNEVEFTLGDENGNVFTQSEAGQMNTRYLFLHSGTGQIDITQGVLPEVKMEIAGTIFRVIPYTTQYNSESIVSVKMSSNSSLVGTVAYDRDKPDAPYRGVSDIGWRVSKFIQANLEKHFSLENARDASTSKGIYLAVAATKDGAPLEGYQYQVITDQKTYVFDAMDASLNVGNNVVKNVLLNLDRAARFDEIIYLAYRGIIGSEITIPADASDNRDLGYYQAEISPNGVDGWVAKTGDENLAFYQDVTFSCIDEKTQQPADWVTVKYSETGDRVHWMLTSKANTSDEERTAIVTATYGNVGTQYLLMPGYRTKTVKITQKSASAKKILSIAWNQGNVNLTDAAVTNLELSEWIGIKVDGNIVESWATDANNEQLLYGSVKCTPYVFGTGVGPGATVADWITLDYGKDSEGKYNSTHLHVNAEANPGAEQRHVVVQCVYTAPAGYEFEEGLSKYENQFEIFQDAKSVDIQADFSGFLSEAVAAKGGTVTGKLSLTVNGEPASDIKSTMSTYGLSLSVNKGATATVDASGNVEVVIPENKYKNGGVEYTLSLNKSDGSVAASVVIKQKEGTEEGEPTCPYTYELQIVKNDGEGFGMGANLTGDHGNWAFIRNIKKDGVTVTLTQEIAEEVLAFAYRGMEPSDSEKAQHNQTSKVASASAVVPVVRWFGGVQIDVTLNTGASNQITKIVGYNSDGTEFGSFFVWID